MDSGPTNVPPRHRECGGRAVGRRQWGAGGRVVVFAFAFNFILQIRT